MKSTQSWAVLIISATFFALCAVQAAPQKTIPRQTVKVIITKLKKPVIAHKRSGKLGEVLTDGQWRFQVMSLDTLDSFHLKHKTDVPSTWANVAEWNVADRVLTARPGYRLIVLVCRVTNLQKTARRLWTSPTDEKLRTALVDTKGASHRAIAFDYPGAPTQTPLFSPGSVQIFSVVFGVKQETRLKELVFTLKHNDYFYKGNDARVAMTWPKSKVADKTSTPKVAITPAAATPVESPGATEPGVVPASN